jgi:hypothetical protein
MNKPVIKYEQGEVIITAEFIGDFDKDGKPSLKSENKLTISAYELVTEIAKKDIALLELILNQIKIG